MNLDLLKKTDPEVGNILSHEIERQKCTIDLCASANRASEAVLAASGSVFSDKPAEGYPGKRFHGGCRFIDEIERLAIERAKHLFGCEHVNVQPHCGSHANMSVFLTILNPGDTFMGLELRHGGHLTHGHPVNFSGKFFNPVSYKVNRKTGLLDFEEIEKLAKKFRPKLIIAGYTAYPRIVDFKKFKEIADMVGAYFMADIAHIAGLVAAGFHPSPIPWCDFATGTTYKTLGGSRGGFVMCKKEFAERIDKAVFPGTQGGMIGNLITAKAVTFKEALTQDFKKYQRQIVANAKALGEYLIDLGYDLVTGGTDIHLMLVDLTNKNITGRDAQINLSKVGITVDKNLIPYDTKSPYITSGIRIGTSVVTRRGMKQNDMKKIAYFIDKVLSNIDNERIYSEVYEEVKAFCEKFSTKERMC